MTRSAEVFYLFLRLGLTSFGGPAAHLVYFEQWVVRQKAWMDEQQYRQLVALCQFLPGPASSQVGIGIGLQHAGFTGALLAFIGFTLPSFLLMTLAGLVGSQWFSPLAQQGALCALVVIVGHAIWQMSNSLIPDWPRRCLAGVALLCFLLWPQPFYQLLILLVFALFGACWLQPHTVATITASPQNTHATTYTATYTTALLLTLFALLLFGLPVVVLQTADALLQLADACYRAGAMVFGGGHVVLPLLEQNTAGLISEADFLSGYALAQLVPGPLFSFAAYIGAAAGQGVTGALLATVMLFLPGGLLVCALWPWWHRLSQYRPLLGAVTAVNCAVVGLLAAAWCQFIVPHAVSSNWHLLVIAVAGLVVWRRWCPPIVLLPLLMIAGAMLGWI